MIWINYWSIQCRYASFMFICICHAVNDSTIRKVVSNGAISFRDLSSRTGCGTQCGSCVAQARAVMNETLSELGLAESEVKLSVVSSA
jgi:bacterioferritin-associated ferredoxin